MGTDKDWEKWGVQDPYFGVISTERFRTGTMSHGTRNEFFATGEKHISQILSDLRRTFDPVFTPKSALDFGCGVGRLIIPLARRVEHVIGVDISSSMIAEARRNCEDAGIHNVNFVESDDALSRVSGSFDLVHSYIVLQHINWQRGRRILQAMAGRVAPGGCLAVQILSGCDAPRMVRALVQLRYAFPPANWLRNLIKLRPMFEPAMQLHVYDLDVINHDLKQHGFICAHTDVKLANFRSTFVYAQRGATASPPHNQPSGFAEPLG